jgi:hypothetical protein
VRSESLSVAEPSRDDAEPLRRDGVTEPRREEVTEVKRTLDGSGVGVRGRGVNRLAWSGGGTTSCCVMIVGGIEK